MHVAGKDHKKDNPDDFYETPVKVVDSSVDLLFCGNQGIAFERVLDPGFGTGRWGQGIRKRFPLAHIHGIDINESFEKPEWYNSVTYADFRTLRPEPIYDAVIGNPPYGVTNGKKDDTLAEKAVRRGMQWLKPNGVLLYLLKSVFTEAQNRAYGLFIDHPPSYIYQSIPRIPWRPDQHGNNSNTVAYSVFVFHKNPKFDDTKLRWFDWRGDKTIIIVGGKIYECIDRSYFSEIEEAHPLREKYYRKWKGF